MVSKNFLYFNDDLFLLRPSCPDDFITPDGKIKVYIKKGHYTYYTTRRKYKRQCSVSCKRKGINGQCDIDCNTIQCLYDNGECDSVAHKKLHGEAYPNAITYVNYLLDYRYKYVLVQ